MTQQPQNQPPPRPQDRPGQGTAAAPPPVWDERNRDRSPTPADLPDGSGFAIGGLVFAGVLLLVNGVLAILQGISALAGDDVYERIGDYVYEMNLTGWGWTMLVLGVLLCAIGYGVLTGAWWARMSGVFLASASLVLHFLFLPYAPVWGVIMVAVDFFVIWSLATAPPVRTPGNGPR